VLIFVFSSLSLRILRDTISTGMPISTS
jgi:hypothetical protein